jgi:hypothetical protein
MLNKNFLQFSTSSVFKTSKQHQQFGRFARSGTVTRLSAQGTGNYGVINNVRDCKLCYKHFLVKPLVFSN